MNMGTYSKYVGTYVLKQMETILTKYNINLKEGYHVIDILFNTFNYVSYSFFFFLN